MGYRRLRLSTAHAAKFIFVLLAVRVGATIVAFSAPSGLFMEDHIIGLVCQLGKIA